MSERTDEIQSFLKDCGWAKSERTPIAGDMSSRSYFRLRLGREGAILMDADTSMKPFEEMTSWLASLGLSVPRILGGKPERGLLLLEDFGDTSVKQALSLSKPLAAEIFSNSVELLLLIRSAEPPNLLEPNARELVDWTELSDAHLPSVEKATLGNFRDHLKVILERVLATTSTVSLRDFHTENMMWLPDRQGAQRLGLLDYQDAFLTHPAYDLMSLLTDARTWIPKERRHRVLTEYIERSGDNTEEFELAFASLSAQRNLRIMGIFARSGKHMAHLPNTYRYFVEALEHSAFDAVRSSTVRAIPEFV